MSFHHAEKLCTSNNVTLYQLFVKPSFFPSNGTTLLSLQSITNYHGNIFNFLLEYCKIYCHSIVIELGWGLKIAELVCKLVKSSW